MPSPTPPSVVMVLARRCCSQHLASAQSCNGQSRSLSSRCLRASSCSSSSPPSYTSSSTGRRRIAGNSAAAAPTATVLRPQLVEDRRLGLMTRRRWQSTDAASSASAEVNPKIVGIVDQISQLTLLETADLVASLKTRLNIPDISFAAPASASGAATGASAAAAAPVEEDLPPPAAAEKTMFTLKLESFEAAAKPKVIKEVKSMLGLSLVDSKKFVESAPKVLKEGVAKEEAEKIVALLKGLGAVVSMD